MKNFLIAAALLAAATSANADTSVNTTCNSAGCSTTVRDLTIANTELRTPQEIEQFNLDWEEYCKPQRRAPDMYGAIRMVYAHPGCEFGATGK